VLISATSYPFLNVLWDILIVFAWILFIWVAIICFTDIFRRRDISQFRLEFKFLKGHEVLQSFAVLKQVIAGHATGVTISIEYDP